jgi:hypothetical protein
VKTYRCTLTNPQGWRLTVHVGNDTNEQPYDRAEREVNASPEHSRYGPWEVQQTERAT